jgi:tyrosine-protein kinase Etk/Wzc
VNAHNRWVTRKGGQPAAAEPTGVPLIPGEWLRRFALELSNAATQPQTMIALVSSVAGEGTTTVVANLARVLEQDLQRRVLLVDACLSSPRLHGVYGLPAHPGLAEVLRSEVMLHDAIHVSERGSLAIMPAGNAAPGEQLRLLADARLPMVLDQLRREAFDFFLIDCPAVLSAPEAALAARHADATFCVVRSERTRWSSAQRATETLLAAGCEIGGVVLNQVVFHLPKFLYRLL